VARVKWFDNKLNFGFATIVHGERAGSDIFVHQSNVLTFTPGIYRTLRPGEYIEFGLEETKPGSAHKYQAFAVTGPHAGLLMCESSPRRPTAMPTVVTANTVSRGPRPNNRPPRKQAQQRKTHGVSNSTVVETPTTSQVVVETPTTSQVVVETPTTVSSVVEPPTTESQ
jgi:cold shock CspA family protein